MIRCNAIICRRVRISDSSLVRLSAIGLLAAFFTLATPASSADKVQDRSTYSSACPESGCESLLQRRPQATPEAPSPMALQAARPKRLRPRSRRLRAAPST